MIILQLRIKQTKNWLEDWNKCMKKLWILKLFLWNNCGDGSKKWVKCFIDSKNGEKVAEPNWNNQKI
jgi:hypothetical protein